MFKRFNRDYWVFLLMVALGGLNIGGLIVCIQLNKFTPSLIITVLAIILCSRTSWYHYKNWQEYLRSL